MGLKLQYNSQQHTWDQAHAKGTQQVLQVLVLMNALTAEYD